MRPEELPLEPTTILPSVSRGRAGRRFPGQLLKLLLHACQSHFRGQRADQPSVDPLDGNGHGELASCAASSQ